jgi:hypothetical protein
MKNITSKRVVPVTVNVTTGNDSSVTITCNPDPAPIIKGTSNVLLVFTLANTAYRFRTHKAIELDVPLEDFPFSSWTINDTLAALYDCNKVADLVKYTVHVVDVKTGQEYSVDPEIKNGGGGGPGGDGDC